MNDGRIGIYLCVGILCAMLVGCFFSTEKLHDPHVATRQVVSVDVASACATIRAVPHRV